MATKSTKNTEFKELKELLKLVKELGYAEFEFESENFFFSLKTDNAVESNQVVYAQQPATQPQQQVEPAVQQKPSAQQESEQDSSDEETPKENLDGVIFKAPMVGTFYRRPSPDKDPFVGVGDDIKEGSPLCVIEAMKLFNEVEYEGPAGKIIKVFVEDATPVEYDQPLFLVEPKV